jgi:hypothetical protein
MEAFAMRKEVDLLSASKFGYGVELVECRFWDNKTLYLLRNPRDMPPRTTRDIAKMQLLMIGVITCVIKSVARTTQIPRKIVKADLPFINSIPMNMITVEEYTLHCE